jgi:hypothetical protein
MKAARVHRFGPPEVITIEETATPLPGDDEILVRVAACGVGPWDAWVRAGKSAIEQPLPLTLGADLSGTVAARPRSIALTVERRSDISASRVTALAAAGLHLQHRCCPHATSPSGAIHVGTRRPGWRSISSPGGVEWHGSRVASASRRRSR